jgi:hypothetical protein
MRQREIENRRIINKLALKSGCGTPRKNISISVEKLKQ